MIRLQRSLALEAEHGFADLQGRQSRFSVFLQQSCAKGEPSLPAAELVALQHFATSLAGYSSLSLEQRRRLVSQLRQHLHQLRQRLDPPAPPGPPRLRLAEEPRAATSSGGRDQASTPLAELKGVGPKLATRLAQLGLFTFEDLIRHYPRDYVDYSRLVRIQELEPGSTATVVATVRRCHAFASPRNPNLAILELQLQDSTGRLRISKFMAGRRFTSAGWLHQQQRLYPAGATLAASGLVKENRFGISLQDPLLEVLEGPSSTVQSEQIGRLVPIYALTEGLTSERLRGAIKTVLPRLQRREDPLPQRWRQELQLPGLAEALCNIHQPRERDELDAARRRLVFDEFLLLQLTLGQRRLMHRQRQAPVFAASLNGERLQAFRRLLPFQFTAAQERVLQEVCADMGQPKPMARLVQGDVGSGKTVVAIAALLVAIDAGLQGALMAPTEVLAQQHYAKLCDWMPQLHVSVELLTGSTPAPKRRQLLQDLANGQLHLLVGTHALLEDPVDFARLGLVVVDEQHRFGVAQRNRLLSKGLQPHLLTMTATPIPRTLALSVHGDLDVSQIDALPPGRQPIQTQVLSAAQKPRAEALIREQVEQGRQAYVVLPLVDESDKLELRSAIEEHRRLQEEVFPDLQVGLLHGRLSSADKQAAIEAFSSGAVQVLVSTTVVEVGVDVPNATVMLIDHAERFGLAQLHQLRGRVGRGADASHCLLINDSQSAVARQRLEVMARSNDGFEIAEVDLRLRGPGEVLGTRQSGLPDLALASLSDDGAVLEEARSVAQAILDADPQLQQHRLLAQQLAAGRRQQAAAARLN
ncbi:MAG: ATP-dependent DNA helicase RecG [Synechococcus sp.]|nr:ATP-dependent DNA helicase RecG [Synechococcus sp.]